MLEIQLTEVTLNWNFELESVSSRSMLEIQFRHNENNGTDVHSFLPSQKINQ